MNPPSKLSGLKGGFLFYYIMAEGKNKIIVYADWIEIFEPLSDDEAGKLVKHFFRYVNDLNPTSPDRLTTLLFDGSIKPTLKRDLKKWEEIAGKRSEAGKISAEKRKQQEPTKPTSVESVEQTPTKSTVNDKVNVIVNDNEILLKKEPKKKSKKIPLIDFTIPIEERKDRFSAEAFENTKHTSDMITKFVRYWTEPTLDKSKMRFEIVIEKNKTWSMSGRLATWSENNFNKPQNGTGKKSVDDAVREFISE